jgi:hypothetical protein
MSLYAGLSGKVPEEVAFHQGLNEAREGDK